MDRRSIQLAGALCLLIAPLVASAQTVVTAPLTQHAPTLSMPVLFLLVVALLGVATYFMRTRSAGSVVGLLLAVGLTVWAVVGGAIVGAMGVTVSGGDCNKQTTFEYSLEAPAIKSACPYRDYFFRRRVHKRGDPCGVLRGGCSQLRRGLRIANLQSCVSRGGERASVTF